MALGILDFGKNTFQYGIAFKFDVLGAEILRNLTQDLLIKRQLFSTLSRDGEYIVLSKGDGSDKEPYFSLKISGDEIAFGTGWHVTYESWQEWRNLLISAIGSHLKDIPLAFVAFVTTQSVLVAPDGKFKSINEVLEVRKLCGQLLPEDFLQKGAFLSFGDSKGTRTVEVFVEGPPVRVSFTVRMEALRPEIPLAENLLAHGSDSDQLLTRFHSDVLAVLVSS